MTTLKDLKVIIALLEQWHWEIIKKHLKLTHMRKAGLHIVFLKGGVQPRKAGLHVKFLTKGVQQAQRAQRTQKTQQTQRTHATGARRNA